MTLLEVFQGWVLFVFFSHVTLLKLLVVFHSIDEFISFDLNCVIVFCARSLKETLQLVDLALRERNSLIPGSFLCDFFHSLV